MPVAQIAPDNSVAWYHQDQLGSTRLVTDKAGNPLGTYTYDPYGAPADSTGSFDPLLDYAGQYTDDETGFQYLRARYYDPDTGQFLTRDPIVAATMEPYAYAANNPANFTDPSGNCVVVPPFDTAACATAAAWVGGAVVVGVFAGLGGSFLGGWFSGGSASVPPPATSPSTREEYIYQSSYIPAPSSLPGFPNAKKANPKTPIRGGGGKLRKRWVDGDTGNILEWDYQHGAVEVWDRRGRKHLGECDPETGEFTKPGDPSRRPIER